MKGNHLFIFVLALLITDRGFSQGETDKWYMAGETALDFSSGVPVALTDNGATFTWEPSASISDAAGNLLYYTDGTETVYNKNHVPMLGGTGHIMNNTITQGAIFVPKPGDPDTYYFIYSGGPLNAVGWTLYYAIIDANGAGGLGRVTSKNMGFPPSAGICSEKMAVTKHCNGTDYWLLVHDDTGSIYKAYLISATGIDINNPVISNIGTAFGKVSAVEGDSQGQMKFSPNGTKLATIIGRQHLLELSDFDKSTGVVSNTITLGSTGTGIMAYGTEFSPDNTKVYSCGTGTPSPIKQWDLCAGSNAAIIASETTIAMASGDDVAGMQLGPDDKIYVRKWRAKPFNSGIPLEMGVINLPNIAGAGCDYSDNGPILIDKNAGGSGFNFPAFISNYFDKPENYTFATPTQVDATDCSNSGSATVTMCDIGTTYLYTWSNGTVEGPTTDLISTLPNLFPGSYHVITSYGYCIPDDTTYFDITGPSETSDTQYVSICTGTSYTLPGGDVTNMAGTYVDTLLLPIGCDSIITTILDVNTTIGSAQNITICSGESYTLPKGNITDTAGTFIDTLIAIGGCDSIVTTTVSITPNTSDTLTPQICTEQVYISPSGKPFTISGTFNDTLTSTLTGCDSLFVINLEVVPLPITNIDTSICTGQDFVLPSGKAITSSGIYTDTISSNGICDSIVITNLTIDDFIPGTLEVEICEGESYTLPDGSVINTQGEYTYTVPNPNGCDSLITASLTVNALPLISTSGNVVIKLGESTTLTANGVGNFLWSPSTSLDCDTCPSVVSTPEMTLDYLVTLTDINGCMASETLTVTILSLDDLTGFDIYLPNVFTVNADGLNDTFHPIGHQINPEGYSLSIYDRWGELLFESKLPDKGWDGFHDGVALPQDVYGWILRFEDDKKNLYTKFGKVTILK